MTNRVVLVTGGGTGIGAAVARQLAKAGDRVVICGRRPEPLQRVAEPTGALAVVADVSEASGVTTVVEEAIAAFGRLDGLVLNHGIIRTGQVDDLSPQDWEDTLRVNLTGPFLLMKAALPHLLRARGAVVSVASVAALRASEAMAAYSASKAGLVLLTQSLAVDYGPDGLRANVVCRGGPRPRWLTWRWLNSATPGGSPPRTHTGSRRPRCHSAARHPPMRWPARCAGCCPKPRPT